MVTRDDERPQGALWEWNTTFHAAQHSSPPNNVTKKVSEVDRWVKHQLFPSAPLKPTAVSKEKMNTILDQAKEMGRKKSFLPESWDWISTQPQFLEALITWMTTFLFSI